MYTMYFFTDVLLNPNADSTPVIAKIKEMPRSLFFVTIGYIHPSFCTMRKIQGCYLENHVNYMKFHISLFCCSWLLQNYLHGVKMLLETQKSRFFSILKRIVHLGSYSATIRKRMFYFFTKAIWDMVIFKSNRLCNPFSWIGNLVSWTYG